MVAGDAYRADLHVELLHFALHVVDFLAGVSVFVVLSAAFVVVELDPFVSGFFCSLKRASKVCEFKVLRGESGGDRHCSDKYQ